jgi:hypothetical protein
MVQNMFSAVHAKTCLCTSTKSELALWTGPPGPPGPGVDPAAAVGVPIAQAGPMLVPQPDYSDVLDRITRELSTDTMEIANLDAQVGCHETVARVHHTFAWSVTLFD